MKAIASIFVLGCALVVASTVFAAEPSGQPLTRADCDKAGMGWDERANVCISNPIRPASGSQFANRERIDLALVERGGDPKKADMFISLMCALVFLALTGPERRQSSLASRL